MTYENAEKQLFNEALSEVEKTNKALLKVYTNAQKEIESLLLTYQKQKLSGDYVPSQEEFRLKALYQQIDTEIDKIYQESAVLITDGYKYNYELAYYKHAYNIEREINLGMIGADYALNFPVLPSSAIEAGLSEAIGGFNFSERLGAVSDSAKFTMRGKLAEVLAKGDTVKNLAKELKALDVWNEAYTNRAYTTARTEMLRAYSYGQNQARIEAETSGVEFKYKWAAALDGRTRYDHVVMNGKLADIIKGEPFFRLPDGSGGAGLRMQGLSAAESINCRCRRLDLPFNIEPTTRAVKMPDGTYETIDFNVDAESWIKEKYNKEF